MTLPIRRRPENAGIKRLDCPVCGRPNAHHRLSTGWQCLACKNLTEPFESTEPGRPQPLAGAAMQEGLMTTSGASIAGNDSESLTGAPDGTIVVVI